MLIVVKEKNEKKSYVNCACCRRNNRFIIVYWCVIEYKRLEIVGFPVPNIMGILFDRVQPDIL